MNISKFKILDGGLSGVRIESIEKMPHENMMFLDDVQRTRKVPLSDELRNKIQNLKYFYLNLTSHWISPFNNYFDLSEYKLGPLVEKDGKMPQGQSLLHDIWNHTKITGVTIKNGGFVITGEIEVVEGKKIGIATPFITEEDDLSFYLDARKHIENIMNDLPRLLKAGRCQCRKTNRWQYPLERIMKKQKKWTWMNWKRDSLTGSWRKVQSL